MFRTFTMLYLAVVGFVFISFTSASPEIQETQENSPKSKDTLFHHHDYEQMVSLMYQVNKACPEITRIYNLSEPSVENRNLTVIEITKNPGVHSPGKPEFKYVANMHGNEVVGKEMVLYFLVYLCAEYKKGHKTADFIVSQTRVHILPSMNPDGWQAAFSEKQTKGEAGWMTGRANANNVDLNRNFPDLNTVIYQHEEAHSGNNNHLVKVQKAIDRDTNKTLQPETRAVMRWIAENGFVLSANLHGGDLVANYPYDESRNGKSQEYTACPDDYTFKYLAESYAYYHATMADPSRKPCDMTGYKKPITNGALWYSVAGGMQDYNYLNTNCFEITLELGCNKFPNDEDLPQYWAENRAALYNYVLQTHIGVKGFVATADDQPIANAEIKVYNMTTELPIDHDILSLEGGDYYRLLGDGYYRIEVTSANYHPSSKCVRVENEERLAALLTPPQVNFTLTSSDLPLIDNEQDKKDCKDLKQMMMLEFEHEERSLLVSALGYLAPEYQWTGMSGQLSTRELYIILYEAINSGENAEEAGLVLQQLPRGVRARLLSVVEERAGP